MIIGLFSDTHDNLPAIARAVAFFNRKKVSAVLHAGDFVAPFAVRKINQLACPWEGVFGNNDGEHKGLADASAGRIKAAPLRIVLGGRQIVVVHSLAQLDLKKVKAGLVVCGHTHQPSIEQRGSTLIVNPGECCGWLSGVSTVALVDLERMKASLHRLPAR